MADLIAVRPNMALFEVGNGLGVVVNSETLHASDASPVAAIIAAGGWVRPAVFPENVHALAEVADSVVAPLSAGVAAFDASSRTYRAPRAVQGNAAQGLATAGEGVDADVIHLANTIVASAALSLETVSRINDYFTDDSADPATWDLHGGQAARDWVRSIFGRSNQEVAVTAAGGVPAPAEVVTPITPTNYDGQETGWIDPDQPHEFRPAEDSDNCFLCGKSPQDPVHAVQSSASMNLVYPDETALRAALAAYFATFNKAKRAHIRKHATKCALTLGLEDIVPSVWLYQAVTAAAPPYDPTVMPEDAMPNGTTPPGVPSIGTPDGLPLDMTPVDAPELPPGTYFSELVNHESAGEDDEEPIVVVGLFHKADDGDVWHAFDPASGMWAPCPAPNPDDHMVQLDDDAASDVLDSTSNPEADNYVELATDEQALFDAAKSQLDWDVIDAVTLATQDQPGYTPEERSQNATKQVRDSGGKFARSGNQVTKQDGTKATIKSVNHDGSIEVENSSGKTDKVNAADVTVSPVIAKLSQPLPLIQDPGAVIDAYLKSVQEQRKAEPPAAAPTTAAGDPAPAPVETAVGPDNSDVAPLYLAVVDAHDASAVLDLVALVPPGPNDPPGAVTGWNRKDGKWVSDPHIIEDLRGSTPPPVVQLDAATEQEVVQQVDAAQSQAQPTTAAGSLFPSGAMIALYPPSNVTPQLTAIGGTDGTSPDDLHVTLVYFGDVDELAASTDLDQLAAAVGEFASRTAALEGEISGVGRFSGDSDMGDPWYASVDVPGLVQFRNSLLDLLDDLGVSYKTNHGFTPHITLGYLDQSATTPVDRINSIPVSFGNLSLALGETVVTFPFGGSDELPELGLEPLPDMDFSGDELEPQLWGEDGSLIVAAAGVDTHPAAAERLRIYWAHGEGAAKIKWGVPGDWKRCVHHLEKFMGVRAKGYCTLRHHDALGVYPGQEDGGRGHKKHFSYEDATAFVAKQFEAITAAGANYPATVEQVQKGVPFVIPVLVPEGVETGDGRSFAQGALTTRTLPLPLLWQQRTQDGHDESVIVGRIDSIDRLEAGGLGNARGVFDTGEHAQEAVRLIRNLMLSGVSADLDSFEARPIKSTTDETKEDSDAITSEKMEITSARLMAATLVAKPAFQECRIKLVEDGDAVPDGDYSGEVSPVEASALVACAAVLSSVPVNPPKTWFESPNLDKPTHLTVTDDGRVYGHIAAWHVDHVGLPMGTKPPRSASNYAYFRTGVIRTQEGDDIPVGQITLTGGHAPLSATASEAVRHYDDTKSAMCDVAAGEDEFGIWVAGALRPDASPQQLRAFRAASPSGDWRPIKGKLELVAVCQVNVPGFPVVRARVASGAVTALVAAGAATLAHLRVDPYSTETLAARVAALEGERLNEKAAKIRERMAPILASRKATEFDIADIIGDDEPDPVDGMDQLEPMDDAAPEATDLVSAVTALFASTVTFYLKAHGYHWNVRGGDFREYHGLFEEIYDDVYNAVDPMAEILQKLGAPSPYKLTEFANLTRVQDADPGTDVASMVQDLVDANEVVLGQIVAAFDMATQASEQGAASFLADRQDMHQKWRWFLNASLNKAAVTAALAAGDLATAKAMLASRVEPIRNERVAALSAKAAELSTRVMGKTKDERKAELLAQREALVARVGLAEAPPLHVPEGDWKEALHPRDDHGQFRDVLFHLTGLLHSSDPGASGVVAEVAKAADAQDAGNNTQAKELGHGAIAKLNDLIGKADSPEQHARLTQAVDALTHTVTTTPDAPPVEDHILTKPAEDTTNYVIEQLKTSVDPGAKQLLKKLERATGQAGAVSPQEIAAWLAEAMRYIVTPDAMQRPLQPQIPTP